MADVTITGLPNAAALTGAERVPMDQAGVTVDAAASAIAGLATKATVGLGNVDNTSDAAKPISTATQSALDGKAAAGAIGSSGLTMTAGILARESGTGAPQVYSIGSGLSIVGGALTATASSSGTVSSVALSLPGIFSVSGSPITTSGTLSATLASQTAGLVFAGPTSGAAAAPTFRALTAGDIPTLSTAKITGLATVATTGAYGDLSGRPSLGGAAALNVGTTAGTVAAGDDARFAQLQARLDGFRDAATFYASKRATASDSNAGTSEGEPFATIGAAVAAANAYVTANPGAKAKVHVGPGEFIEASLPFRLKPNILAQGALQRGTVIKPAAGQELNGFWALDSGCMICDFTFAGHQATGTSPTDSSVGTRAWAVRFNELANGGQGVILTASPYVKDCASITAEDDAGVAGSTSTGDTGGGVEVDGGKCHPSSPIRSMVIYGFTQQNLGGPGAVIKNDAYAELVSFFGLFGTWHVQCETGGQATLSGGGCSEFGIYGLVADGYSTTALFTGSLRVAASSGATTVDVVSLGANRLGSSSRPAAGQVMLLGGSAYVVTSGTPIDASGSVVADSAPTRAGYRVNFYNPTGTGLTGNVAQGATANFRQRSQISAGCHSANYVGSGTNYSALPWNGGVPIRGNEAVERNYGRVFGLIVNDIGDVKVAGGAFAVDGTTGAVTINTSQFNLSGLNAIGPFSRNGGISSVGVQLQEVSNAASLLASTGTSDGNTAPTQFAVRSYVDNRFLAGLTATAGQPLTVSDTSTQDGSGFWTRSRNVSLSLNTANGLAQLDGSGLIPSALLPSYVDDVIEAANFAALPGTGATGKIYVTLDNNRTYRWSGSTYVEISASPGSTDAVAEGSVNLYFTAARARQSISVSGSLAYDQATGVISYTAPTLAAVATSGAYGDLTGRPTLGTAAALNSGTAAGNVVVLDGSGRLPAVDGSLLTGLTTGTVTSVGGTAPISSTGGNSPVISISAATTSAAGSMSAADKTKLDGIAAGATANATDAQLRDRSTHTGTQAASTITGLAAVATTGAYADLSGKPTLGTAAALDVAATGDATSGQVVKGNDSRLTDARTPTAHTQTASTISDSTAAGRALLTAADAAAQRTALALGSLATQSGTFSGTSSGTNTGDQTITLTGDVTGSGTGSFAATLASTAVTAGSYGSASQVVALTVDAKGRLTAAANTSISIPATAISDSTVAGRALLTAADASAQRTSLGLGTFATANAATPPAIGGTTPAAGSFSVLTASAQFTLPSGAPGTPTARDVYAVADTIRYRDSSNVERLLLNATDNLANLANTATARSNLGAQKAITSGTAAPSGGVDGDIYLQYT